MLRVGMGNLWVARVEHRARQRREQYVCSVGNPLRAATVRERLGNPNRT